MVLRLLPAAGWVPMSNSKNPTCSKMDTSNGQRYGRNQRRDRMFLKTITFLKLLPG